MAKLRVDKIASVGVSTENTGSVYFDGTSDGLRSSPYDELIIGTGAFTVECWFWRQNITDSWGSLVSDNLYSGAGGWDLYTQYNDIRFYVGGVGEVFTVSDCYSAQTWTHVAVQRDSSGNMSCYINGVEKGVTATNSTDYTDNRILIGGNNSPAGSYPAYVFNGYISNVRVCRGHTVYTSNFAVPTRELEVHPGPSNDKTIFLACYDGENIFAEKTGKIIAANGDRLSSPTPTATDSPIGITTENPGLTRDVDNTFGPVFQGGAGYASQNWLTLPKGTTTDRNLCGTRGLFAGSNPQPADNSGKTIEFITVSTTGNTTDFGDRTGNGRRQIAAMSNRTRGVFAGSYSPMSNIIDYVSIPTTGNAVDFGDTLTNLTEATGISNSTRGIIAGGRTPTVHNVMQYVTIPTLGNATDFGDLTGAKRNAGSFQSSTRGIVAGGRNPGGTSLDVIEYVTIASTGDAIDFGDISSGGGEANMGGSNSTRGLVAGGSPSTNTITYVTISTLGNSVDFGDNTAATNGMNTMATSPTRACMFGAAHPARTLSYVEIATTGNALDFGSFGIDATTNYSSGCSSGHGGIS